MTDWDTLVGPAVEHELLRLPDARRCYDSDAGFRASLALLAEHLAVVATVMEGQGFPRFSVEDTLRRTIERVLADGTKAAGERIRARIELQASIAHLPKSWIAGVMLE